jgi:dihydrofolate reductase
VRTLAVNTFLSLDGVMQGPGAPEEDPSGGFTHGGWSVNYWDDIMGRRMTEALGTPFDLLLGRKTYEIFAAHWPHAGDDPTANSLNRAAKHVASTTLDTLGWNNSTLLQGPVPEAVAALKDQSGPEIQVHGSWNLLQTLMKHDLVDEYRLWTFPVLLGTGKRLFTEGTIPTGLEVVDVMTSTTGVVFATYRRSGTVDYGSFAFEEPTPAEVERRRRLAEEERG